MNPALSIFVVAVSVDYEGIVELVAAFPTRPEAEAEALRLEAGLPQHKSADVVEVPMKRT